MMNAARYFSVSLLAMSVVARAADDDSKTYLDPKNAGPDYAIQGEYLGQVESEDGAGRWGARSSHWVTVLSSSSDTKEACRVMDGSEAIAARWRTASRPERSLASKPTNGKRKSRIRC